MKFTLEDKEIDYIYNVLAQRPWVEVNPLMLKIQQQVQMNQKPIVPLPEIEHA